MISTAWRFLIGNPLASSQARAERLGIPLAFVIVSANALSSVAYASEEIFYALNPGGEAGRTYAVLIGLAIVLLMFAVVLSYYHVIRAYPTGGGAYVVAKENLGPAPSVVTGASLLVDYILTVSVSVTAGAAALVSAFPAVASYGTELAILFVVVLVVINLRGVRQSAQVLAFPVYLFVGALFAMAIVGIYKYVSVGSPVVTISDSIPSEVEVLGLLLLLRAFSSGCVALTGIEAISNSVGIFQAPESRNARITLLIMGVLLASLFLGVTVLSFLFGIHPVANETLVSQVAKASFGLNGFYYLVQFSTLLILVVAANTSFSAFPQLASRLAHDGFLPKPLSNLGDRLVLSNGILLLAASSIFLIVMFRGNTHYLLPLYAIGVFTGFTLTQAGIAVHWWRQREPTWRRSMVIGGFGAFITGVVLMILTAEKFTSGAWIVVTAVPVMLLLFSAIRGHYRTVAEALSLEHYEPPAPAMGNMVIIPIGGVHRAVLPVLEYARLIGTWAQAVHIAVDEEAAEVVRERWSRLQTDVPLVVIPSPYREMVRPLVSYLHEIAEAHPSQHITVVIPEFVPKRWWHFLLHNQNAFLLKIALLFQRRIILVSVPYHLPK